MARALEPSSIQLVPGATLLEHRVLLEPEGDPAGELPSDAFPMEREHCNTPSSLESFALIRAKCEQCSLETSGPPW